MATPNNLLINPSLTLGQQLQEFSGLAGGGFIPLQGQTQVPGATDALSTRDLLGLGVGGLGALSQILQGFSGISGNKLLKEQLKMTKGQYQFAKDMAQKNYANQLKAFNTALEDSANAYFEKHKLTGA